MTRRISCIALIALFIAFLSGCSYIVTDRLGLPKELITVAFSVLSPPSDEASFQEFEEAGEEPGGMEQDAADDEQEGIEENINCDDLEEDQEMTEGAEEDHITQEDVGVAPENEEFDELDSVEISVIREFETQLPAGYQEALEYDKYPIGFDYVLIQVASANIREEPSTSARIVAGAQRYERLSLRREVRGEYHEQYETDSWYEVYWKEGDAIQTGYLLAPLAEVRRFQFDKMAEVIERLMTDVEAGKMAYVHSYKNVKGSPPLWKGKTVDEYGNRRSQSAPGYLEPDTKGEFRYIPDGTLLKVLKEEKNLVLVWVPSFQGQYWIPRKYIRFYPDMQEITKVIVVDRSQQNQAAFHIGPGGVRLVSYTLATTGKKGPYSFETPLGMYMAIQKRDRFQYYGDGTTIIEGYAPYAVRFSGGGYIHGVPVNYQTIDGQRVDPGMKEYLHTIGTDPRSHMCVRNYTSHAKFLYDWVEIGKSAVIVVE
ncbi:MAG: L,D-transpeptidase family protein [Clostridia bacterium]|jgi:hypothetical protein